MAEPSNKTAAPLDLEDLAERTQAEALKRLSDAELEALLKELRTMKLTTTDVDVARALSKALRRTSDEKAARLASGAWVGSGSKAAKAPSPTKLLRDGKLAEKRVRLEAKASKLEDKGRTLAEKAEKLRVKVAKKDERKKAMGGGSKSRGPQRATAVDSDDDN